PCRRRPRRASTGSRALRRRRTQTGWSVSRRCSFPPPRPSGWPGTRAGWAGLCACFFPAAEAERLAGHPGRVDAIGVLAESGVDVGALRERVGAALEGNGARGHAGEESGLVGVL